MAGNWRSREPSHRWEAERAAWTSHTRLHRPEERDFFTTANWHANGEQAQPATPRSPFRPCGTCSTTELQALPPDGIRTRDTVVISEVADRFTTVGHSDAGEQSRRKRHPLRKAFPKGLPVARVATPIAVGASTVRSRMPGSPRPLSWRSGFCAKYPYLHHRQTGFQGNVRRSLLRFTDEGFRAFTTWN